MVLVFFFVKNNMESVLELCENLHSHSTYHAIYMKESAFRMYFKNRDTVSNPLQLIFFFL